MTLLIYRKLCNEIIKSGLKIEITAYARLEKEFNEELLSLAKEAGVIELMWGFESVNERVLGLMNKTKFTDKNARLEIMKTAHKVGIENTCDLMVGFPSETMEEAMETFNNFIKENKDLIKNVVVSKFMVKEHSPILEDFDKFSLLEVSDKDEFDLYYYSHKTSSGLKSRKLTK